MCNSDGNEIYSTQGHPRGYGNKHNVDMNVPGQAIGQGGQVRVQDELDDIGGGWNHKNDGNSIRFYGTQCWIDGAVSSAHHKLK